MDIEYAAYPSAEINTAALDLRPEHRAGLSFQNNTCQTKTIRLHQSSNAHSVTD
jgi:hypothetical protein